MTENHRLLFFPLRHEEAAALPFGGTTALHFLQKVNIPARAKSTALRSLRGSGNGGRANCQNLGAEVTGVCSTANLERVKALGADHVIDYTKIDFAKNGERYDVVYETVNKAPFSSCIAVLQENGTLLLGATMLAGMVQGAWLAATSNKKVVNCKRARNCQNSIQKQPAYG